MIRVGLGEDLHLLVPDRQLILGGVNIPYEFGLLGHSDADVILHAVSDALLGAISSGDIGTYFPPNDPAFKDIDSKKILAFCLGLVKKKGFHLVNVDIVIKLEKPKLRPYVEEIRRSVAEVLGVERD